MLLVAFDWGRRTVRIGPMLTALPNAAVDDEIGRIQAHFAGVRGRAGVRRTPILRKLGQAIVRARVGTSPEFDRVTTHGDELREVLSTSALFGDATWDEAVLQDLVAEFVTVVVKGGDVVVRRGEQSDDLLLVVSGRLRVVLEASDGGAETVLAELGRGETVGEAGLITGDPRSATVYAIRDAILATLDRESFEALCRRHPQAMMERFAGGTLRRMIREARGERSPRRDSVARSHSSAPMRELRSNGSPRSSSGISQLSVRQRCSRLLSATRPWGGRAPRPLP